MTTLVFVILHGKPYYLAPAYPPLFAAGAVVIERSNRWLRGAVLAAVVAGGAALAPVALPTLAPNDYGAYAERLGISPPQDEKKELGVLPQHLADQMGWRELAVSTSQVF